MEQGDDLRLSLRLLHACFDSKQKVRLLSAWAPLARGRGLPTGPGTDCLLTCFNGHTKLRWDRRLRRGEGTKGTGMGAPCLHMPGALRARKACLLRTACTAAVPAAPSPLRPRSFARASPRER